VNLKPRRHEEPEINVVSLIDVVLLLVVFFILSSRFSDEGRLRVHLPHAGAVPIEKVGGEPLVVSVTQQGGYLVNGHELINASPRRCVPRCSRKPAATAASGSRCARMPARLTSPSSPPWTCSAASGSPRSISRPSSKRRRVSLERRSPPLIGTKGVPPLGGGALRAYRRLLVYLRPYRGRFILGILGGVLFSATMASFALLAKKFGDGTFGHQDRAPSCGCRSP